MDLDGTELISFPAEQRWADLAAASTRKDNGKHINQPWVIRTVLQALATCDCVGYALVPPLIPQLCLTSSPRRKPSEKSSSLLHLHSNNYSKGSENGKCDFFVSFDWFLEQHFLPAIKVKSALCRQNSAFCLFCPGSKHEIKALPARFEEKCW